MSDNYKFETLQLHVRQEEPDPVTDARAVPIYYTLQALAQNGGHVVAKKTIYGGSNNHLAHTLPNRGIYADQ